MSRAEFETIAGLERFIGHLNEWVSQYGLGHFTWARYCTWMVETYPQLVAEILTEEMEKRG
jgi:hypothetical protein